MLSKPISFSTSLISRLIINASVLVYVQCYDYISTTVYAHEFQCIIAFSKLYNSVSQIDFWITCIWNHAMDLKEAYFKNRIK